MNLNWLNEYYTVYAGLVTFRITPHYFDTCRTTTGEDLVFNHK